MKRKNSLKIIGITVVLVTGSMPQMAVAYCSEPRAPANYLSKPTKPTAPFCVNEFLRTHTCDDWQIDRYNSEVREYNDTLRRFNLDLQIYANELESYVREARDYAQCELDRLAT